MDALREVALDFAWFYNGFGVALVAITYVFHRRSQSNGVWAGIGCILLLLATTNAFTLGFVGVAATEPVALLGMMVFAPLGSTFLANWLTHQVEPRELQEDMLLKVLRMKLELEKQRSGAEIQDQGQR